MFKAYCNSKRSGFGKALEWPERQPGEIHSLARASWAEAEAADPRLCDFLFHILSDDALMLIERLEPSERGFESWRRLVQQYEPRGGAFKLDATIALMTHIPVKDISALPAAIARFEKDYRAYERRSGNRFSKSGRPLPCYAFCRAATQRTSDGSSLGD